MSEAASGATTSPATRIVKTADLYQRFEGICGRCHVNIASGGFQVNANTFATVFDQSRMARLESNDPSFAMPPENRGFSSRSPDDPVVQLAKLLEAWLAQGRPADMFEFDDPTQTTHAAGFYAYSTLSNMGDCIPAKTTYASSTSGEMDAKDTFFASLFKRFLPRLQGKGAAWAVAHRIARVVWMVLHNEVEYKEQGPGKVSLRTLDKKFKRILAEFAKHGIDPRTIMSEIPESQLLPAKLPPAAEATI